MPVVGAVLLLTLTGCGIFGDSEESQPERGTIPTFDPRLPVPPPAAVLRIAEPGEETRRPGEAPLAKPASAPVSVPAAQPGGDDRYDQIATWILDALEITDYATALRHCRAHAAPASKRADLRRLCRHARVLAVDDSRRDLVEKRDGREVDDTFDACLDHVDLATPLGATFAHHAAGLCEELKVVPRLLALDLALADAVATAGGTGREAPPECEWAVRDLGRVLERYETQWAADQLQRVSSACYEDLPSRFAIEAVERLRAARDSGAGGGDCARINDLPERLPPTTVERLKMLCREVAAARGVRDARRRVAEALEQGSPYVPYECGAALSRLMRLDTRWAVETRQSLATRCYVDLGFEVLAVHVPKMQYVCAVQARKVIEGVRRHGLKAPRLDLLIARAARLCD